MVVYGELSKYSLPHTVKSVLETTCIEKPPALRDHCFDTTTLLKAT